MRKILLTLGGLLLLAAGFVAGKFLPWPSRAMEPRGVAALDKEKFDKDWIYPREAGKGHFHFHLGPAILWAPIISRSVYYDYAAPAPFEKVLAFYEERLSRHLGLAEKDRPQLSTEHYSEWSKAPGQYEYFIVPQFDDIGGPLKMQAVTFSVREMGNPRAEPGHRHGQRFTVFVRRTQNANSTDVSFVYDWEAR